MKTFHCAALMLVLAPGAGCAHRSSSNPAQASAPVEAGDEAFDEDEDTSPARACTPDNTEPAPADGRIGDTSAWKIVTYPVGSPVAPKASPKGKSIQVSANIPFAAKPQSAGVVIAFPKCMDASGFSGVRFAVRGRYSGCTMEYATNDVAHQDRNNLATYATGRRGAYPPQTRLEASQVAEVAQTLTMPFAESTIRGNPALPLDKSKLTALVWQLSVPLAGNGDDGDTRCVAELEVSDVTFYR